MNHIIPMRNERSTPSLYMPAWFSPITVPNQPKNMNTTSAKPEQQSTQAPASTPLSHVDAPEHQ